MKRNGFTLIELLCTICIIAMLSTLISPVLVKKVNKAKEEALDTLISTIKNNSIDYVINNEPSSCISSDLDSINLCNFYINDNVYITISDLVDSNYFDKSLINPITKESIPLTDYIYITRDYTGKISAYYDINQSNDKVQLIGPYNLYMKMNTNYVENGVKVNNIVTNVESAGVLTTSVIGVYKLTYTYNGISITRNIIVE